MVVVVSWGSLEGGKRCLRLSEVSLFASGIDHLSVLVSVEIVGEVLDRAVYH